MRVSAVCLKQTSVLLALVLYFPNHVFSSPYKYDAHLDSNLRLRGGPDLTPRGDTIPCDDTAEASTLDGATNDQSPGIGVEFESGNIVLTNKNCKYEDWAACKGEVIDGRQSQQDNWKLTADTTRSPGRLVAEYILDGTQIKLGNKQAGPAAAAAAADLQAWKPYSGMDDNRHDVGESPCNPWVITAPSIPGPYSAWSVQVTAPLPLENIYGLFSEAIRGNPDGSNLLPVYSPGQNMVPVSPEFFQSDKINLAPKDVKSDTLGFFSLVLSYAKAAQKLQKDNSPKVLTSIMPRTEFVTMYNMIKGNLPPNSGSLYNLVKQLACYKNDPDSGVDVDTNFCSGDKGSPQSNDKLDSFEFHGETALKVPDWIDSIEAGQSPDALTHFDKNIDGSLGGLGTRVEKVLGSDRTVPLFEFRNLKAGDPSEFQPVTENAENEIIRYHQKGVNPPGHQSLQTPGGLFCLIDQKHQSVLLPVHSQTSPAHQ